MANNPNLYVPRYEGEPSPFFDDDSTSLFSDLLKVPSINSGSHPLIGFPNNQTVSSNTYNRQPFNNQNKKIMFPYYQLLKHSSNSMEDVNDELVRSRKIRFFPTTEQKAYFAKCFGTTRYLYNKTISAFKEHIKNENIRLERLANETGCVKMIPVEKDPGSKKKKPPVQCCDTLNSTYFCEDHDKCKLPYKIPLHFVYWRNLIVLANTRLPENEQWLADIPFDTRQLVISNVLGGIKSALTNLKQGNITHFDMKYKSKRNPSQYFFIDRRALKRDMSLWKEKLVTPLMFKKKEKKWITDLMEKIGRA